MSFDPTRLVRTLLGLPAHAELLAQACQVAAEACGQPAFASHGLPGRPWEQATIASSQAPAASPAARSALFAIQRRLLRAPATLHIEREPETEAIFKGLAADAATRLVAVPLLSRQGRPCGALVIAAPPSNAEEALQDLEKIASLVGPAMEAAWQQTVARRDQERLQLFSETTEESLWDWDRRLDEVWWGGNLEQLFGGRAKVSRRPGWRQALAHPDDMARVRDSFDQALAGHESSWTAEYRVRGAGSDAIHVREHVYFLREVDGTAYRAIGTLRDVTALQRTLQREQQARATAEQANVVKDEFLAMLGHELRNPLAPIVTILGLLELRAKGPDRQLEILRRQTQHLVRLVDDLLDVSRISSGKIELARRRVAAEPVIQRAIEMVQPLIEQRGHGVHVAIAAGLELDVDPARMTQVLSNILANAAKYTEPGGRIDVAADVEDGEVAIRIRDDGTGIAPEALPTIFQMFTQGRQSIDRSQGGLGLGLSIVANIVKLHGGTVRAYSDGAGQGTEVVVRLPWTASATEIGRPPVDLRETHARACDLLLVDDNEDAAAMLSEALTSGGHTVRVAHHPDAALRLFAQRTPQVALVDIGLPGMDGYELVRRLRARPDAADTRFVALTGYGLASDKAKAHAAGFAAHLVKPVSLEQLDQLFEQLMPAGAGA